MWRRLLLCFALSAVFSSLLLVSAAEGADEPPASDGERVPGVNEAQEPQITAEDIFRAVGVDPDNEDQVIAFMAFLDACEAQTYDEFEALYLERGYRPAGVDLASVAYCVRHDLEAETFSIQKGDGFERYNGNDVYMTNITKSMEGYQAGDWFLGTSSFRGGYMTFNLSEMQRKVAGALTDTNLEPIKQYTSKMLDLMLEYYPQWLGTSQLLSRFLTDLGGTRNLTLWQFSSSSSGSLGSKVTTSYNSSSFFDTLNQWYQSLARGVYQGFDYLDRDLGSWLNAGWFLSLYDLPSFPFGDSGSDRFSGTGLIRLVTSGINNFSYNLYNGFNLISRSLLGTTPPVFNVTSYDADGNPVSTPSASQYSLSGLLTVSLQALQQDTAALRFVLADEDDIRLKASQKENQGAFEENFTGGGAAAVKPGDIADVGSWSGSMRDIFKDNPASGSDFFGQLTASGNYDFFSETTQASLDAVSNPAAAVFSDGDTMEQWLEDYAFDEDGFASLADMSYFDFTSFLGGGSS